MENMKLRNRIIHSCDKCVKSFKSSEELNTHMNIHLDKVTQGELMECSLTLGPTEDSEITNSIIGNLIYESLSSNQCIEIENIFNILGISMSNPTSEFKGDDHSIIDMDIECLTGEEPFHCNERCRKESFTKDLSMANYTSVKPSECKEPGNDVKGDDHSTLDLHIKHHTGDEPFYCNVRGNVFMDDYDTVDMEIDNVIHTGETCSNCYFKFSFYEEQIKRKEEELVCKEDKIRAVENSMIDLEKINNFYKSIFEHDNILEYVNNKENKKNGDILEEIITQDIYDSNKGFVSLNKYNELLKLYELSKLEIEDKEKMIVSLSENLLKTTSELMEQKEGENNIKIEMNIFKNCMKEHELKLTQMEKINASVVKEIEGYMIVIRGLEKKLKEQNINSNQEKNNDDTQREYPHLGKRKYSTRVYHNKTYGGNLKSIENRKNYNNRRYGYDSYNFDKSKHDYYHNYRSEICTHFSKGNCKFGNSCFKEHKLVICKHFIQGNCRFGDNCWKIHSINHQ